MALSGVLRPGFIQLRVLDMPAAVEHYTRRIGMHQVTEGADGRVYLKTADEFDHHSFVLRRAETAGVDLMAFKVLEGADLDKFEKRVTEYGLNVDHVPAGEQPGIGRRIGFVDPSGNRNEVFAGGYTYYPDLPTRTWDEKEIGKGIFYYERQLNEAFLSVVT